jgi:hypothetical protein
MKRLLVFFLLTFFAVTIQPVYSIEAFNLPKSKVNPGSFIYSAKRFSENMLLKFNSSKEGKVKFYKKLLVTRLSELDYVAGNKKLGEVEKSSQRFAYQAGIVTDYIVSEKLDKEKETLLQSFEQYKEVLAKLRDVYPANTSYWMLLQQDIDTLNINAEKLK